MQLILTWDLLIIVFFAVVVAYSFIIGKHESVKIIICTYIAIVAVQGLGNILFRVSGQSQPLFSILGLTVDFTLLSTTKIILFVAAIIFLAIRSGIKVEYSSDDDGVLHTALTGVCGAATAGLLLSTLVNYAAGLPLLDTALAQAPAVSTVIQQSRIMQVLIYNQDLWFSLPAILVLGIGFLTND